MVIFLPEVSKQLWRQSSKYLHSYNILLLAKYFFSRTKSAFVLGEYSQQGVPGGGIDDMVQKIYKVGHKQQNSNFSAVTANMYGT